MDESRGVNMDDKLIIEALVEQVKNGDIALEQIPDVWRDKVQELL